MFKMFLFIYLSHAQPDTVGHYAVDGSTLAFGYVGNGFESKHRLFSHHNAAAFMQAEITGIVLTGRYIL